MAKKQVEDSAGPGAPAWMVTYGDMMTLLLCFFVLLLSFSSTEQAAFQKAMGSLKGALGILISPNMSIHIQDVTTAEVVPKNEPSNLKEQADQDESVEESYLMMLAQEIQTSAEKSGIGGTMDIVKVFNALRIRLPAEVLFEEAKLDLSPMSASVLGSIIDMLSDIPYNIQIEGHTDNVPIFSEQYDSNWELSGARAVTVLHYFVKKGISPERLSAVACGEFKPIASNDTNEGRERNRRVELVISAQQKEKKKGDK
ncbi:MAG: hypothetical protein C4541_02545 [Candidatus Auribacter fodinae]|jgi:chemotaxis protein MotB|uniref:OmpA-like domain-containing protein n=1 Tax=Candidatus Auribacter fodinae TaxID=2093366 RepID=A0A3A4R4Y4_9BACT|nr:MAG: hypothetical protein C4541_02545 [Candidatus Auribacter fodinae]